MSYRNLGLDDVAFGSHGGHECGHEVGRAHAVLERAHVDAAVSGLGFEVWGVGFKVQGIGLKV